MASLRNVPFTLAIAILDADGATISGPHSIDPAIAVVRVDFPPLNLEGPNGYRPWKGSITLLDTEGLAFNIDSRDTTASPTGAALLAQGNAVDLQIWDGSAYTRPWPTLYILRESQPLDQPLRNTASYEIGDITQLESNQPEGNLSGMEIGTSYTRSTIANNILQAVGLPTSTDVASAYPLSVPTQKFNRESYPSEIGRIMGTCAHMFWVDSTDSTRFTPINLDKTAPDFTLTIGQDEIQWERQNLSERPPGTLRVTGTGGQALARTNPEVLTTVGPEKETDLETEIQVNIARVTITETERLSEREILPEIAVTVDVTIQTEGGGTEQITIVDDYVPNTSTTLRTSRERTTVRQYSTITKRLLEEQIVTRAARGVAGGDAYRDIEPEANAYDLITIDDRTIEYTYSRGKLFTRETRSRRPWCLIPWRKSRPSNYEINRFFAETNFFFDEEWRRNGRNWEYDFSTRRYQGEESTYTGGSSTADVIRESPQGTDLITSEDGGEATPPATQYLPSLFQPDDQQYQGEVEITPLAGQAHKNALRTVAIQGPYVVSDAQCEVLAAAIARISHGNSLAQQFTGEVPSWILSNFEPGARVDADGHAYFLNGWTLTADAESAYWGASLADLGVVGVTPDIVTSPILLSRPITHSVTGPSPTFSATLTAQGVGVTMSVTGPSPTFSATVVADGVVSHNLTGPTPVFNAIAATPGDVGHSLTGPSPEFSAVVAGPDPDATALIARLSGTYSQTELDAIDAWFAGSKTDGFYSKLVAVVVCAADNATDGLLNWISTSYAGTNNSMTFTARQGFTGNGSSTYIDSGLNPSSVGALGQDDMGVSVYIRSKGAGSFTDMGARASSGADALSWRLNTSATTPLSTLTSNSIPVGITSSAITGFHTLTRNSSSEVELYRNGASEGTLSLTSTGKPNANIYVGANNTGGTDTSNSDGQYAMYLVHRSLTDTEAANLNTRSTTLLTVLGANV